MRLTFCLTRKMCCHYWKSQSEMTDTSAPMLPHLVEYADAICVSVTSDITRESPCGEKPLQTPIKLQAENCSDFKRCYVFLITIKQQVEIKKAEAGLTCCLFWCWKCWRVFGRLFDLWLIQWEFAFDLVKRGDRKMEAEASCAESGRAVSLSGS